MLLFFPNLEKNIIKLKPKPWSALTIKNRLKNSGVVKLVSFLKNIKKN